MKNLLTISIITLFHVPYVLPQNKIVKTILYANYTGINLRPLKKAIGYMEDTYLNFTELTMKYGYTTEQHSVTTADGYILTIFRILSKCNHVQGNPVLLMHGITDSSDGWILAGPDEGFGYILSKKCYDVWASNERGNYYSRKHKSLDPDRDPQFWDFSFEKTGLYDVPAVIDYVLMITNKKKLIYIGHSQGSTDFFVMGSLRPEYNDKVQLAVQLAPVAWMAHTRGLLYFLAIHFYETLLDLIKTHGIFEFGGRNRYFPNAYLELFCQVAPLELCGKIYHYIIGSTNKFIRPRTLTIASGHIPSGISTKTLQHFAQLIRSKRFQRFDSGKKNNLKKYGTVQPPQYNVSLISTPLLFICAKNDFLSDLRDVNILSKKLPNLIETYIVPDPLWSHNDLIWSINASEYVFNKILDYIPKISNV